MKKCIILLLLVTMALCAVAQAENATVLNWADSEARFAQEGIPGDFVVIKKVGMKVWVPAALQQAELTKSDTDAGHLARFSAGEGKQEMSVILYDMEGATLEEYKDQQSVFGAVNMTDILVNGVKGIYYEIPDNDCLCASFPVSKGHIVEVTCKPMSDEGWKQVWVNMIASIQGK